MKTLEDVIKATREVIAENPNNVNPMDEDGLCLYNGPDNRHCIAATVFIKLGYDISSADEGTDAGDVVKQLGLDINKPSADFLDRLQCEADDFATSPEQVQGWSALKFTDEGKIIYPEDGA